MSDTLRVLRDRVLGGWGLGHILDGFKKERPVSNIVRSAFQTGRLNSLYKAVSI